MVDKTVVVNSDSVVYEPKGKQEEQAMARGWRPEEQFEGDKEDWVDAKTFNMKGELMDTISKKTKQIKEFEKVVDKLSDYVNKQDEIAFERAKEALMEEKALALDKGDHYEVVKKDEELKQLDKDIEQAKIDAVANTRETWQEAHGTWEKDNDWYTSDRAMKTSANVMGANFMKANPDATPEEMYGYIDTQVRKEFPSAFKNPKRGSGGDIAPASNAGSGGSSGGTYKLSPIERKVAERMVEKGTFKSVDAYRIALEENAKNN